MWLEGHTEPECVGEDEMTGSVESPEYLELPLCGVDPAGGSEEGGEEGDGLREYSCERRREDCSDTVTDALLPKQQGQTQEGERPCFSVFISLKKLFGGGGWRGVMMWLCINKLTFTPTFG